MAKNPPPSKEQATKAFQLMDTDENGALTVTEAVDGLAQIGYNKEQALELFIACNKEKDDKVTCDEFVQEICKEPRRQAIDRLFDEADKNDDGKVSLEELKPLAVSLGFDAETLQRCFELADCDNSGCMDEGEFKRMLQQEY